MYFHMLLLLRVSVLHVSFYVQLYFSCIFLISMSLMCDCHVFTLAHGDHEKNINKRMYIYIYIYI